MSQRRSFLQNVVTYLLPFFVFLLPQTGYSHRQLLQYDEICVFDDGCKPNPEVIQSLIASSRSLLKNLAQCIAYGVDNATCETIPDCTVVADAGKFLNKQFSGYGLCVRSPTTDRAVALNEVRAVYQYILDYRTCFFDDDNSYYITAQCALQEDGCTGDCIEVPEQFPPHCRVNTSALLVGLEESNYFTYDPDPLDGLEEAFQMGKSFVILDQSYYALLSCFQDIDMLNNLLLCQYKQLYAAMNTGKEGVYENCQVKKLYRLREFLWYYWRQGKPGMFFENRIRMQYNNTTNSNIYQHRKF